MNATHVAVDVCKSSCTAMQGFDQVMLECILRDRRTPKMRSVIGYVLSSLHNL